MSTVDRSEDEPPLSSVLSRSMFPGQPSLRIDQVAKALGMVKSQVADLIETGELTAINIANGLKSATNPKGNTTSRKYWRIPASAYDAFVRKRRNSQ